MKVEQSFLDRDEYIEHKSLFDGIQYIFETKSGKKISVVRHNFSHGNECCQGLYELADITDESIDVVQGYLTPDDVIEILEEDE
ncbi:hypothetical protein DOS77_11815 [Staphylococcus felis]|uniref:hypothetical protein n=1 Tax=Staphylococcus felis TaxID=46127 RepID=UPI000E244441|nr:hypothetical protein [Staphylococcus felis]REH95142.1 hypothetical protein DOS67_08005 [Staphylococcus felis]REI19599.1 hypothetical protein DOS77_11815 [Staphylococcus felis]